MRNLTLTALLFALVSCHAGALAMPLEDVLKEVLATNPRVLERLKEYNAAVLDMKRSSAGYYPSVDVSTEGGEQKVANFFSRFEDRSAFINSTRVSARQMVFDGGRVKSDVRSRRELARSALFGYFETANQLAFETIEAYLNVLKYYRLQVLAEESVAIHQRLLEGVRTRVQAGREGKSEMERVVGRMAAAEATYIARSNDYRRTIYVLHKQLGRFLDGSQLVAPAFDKALLPLDLKSGFYKQMENHPTLMAAETNISERMWEYKREKADYLPLAYLEASKDWQNDYNGIEGTQEDARALLKVHYNVFDGGAKKARKDRMVSLVHKEKEALDRVQRSLVNDLQLTWSAYKLLESQIGAVMKSVVFTKKALESYKEEFKLGKRLLINILDAELEYQNARAQLASLQFELLAQKYRVLFSTGTLVDDLKLVLPHAGELRKCRKPRLATRDRLPVEIDFDRDRVFDRKDISSNSLATDKVDELGEVEKQTKEYLQEPVQKPVVATTIKTKPELKTNPIRPNQPTQLDLVSFVQDSNELTSESKVLMREIVEQLTPLAAEGIVQIAVSCREKGSADENYRRGIQRAYNVKKILSYHDVDPDGIQVVAAGEPKGNLPNTVTLKVVTDPKALSAVYETVHSKIRFATEDDALSPAASQVVAGLAADVKRLGNPPVDVVVYSNDSEDPAENEALSARRADRIRAALGAAGVPTGRIVPVAWGHFGISIVMRPQTAIDGAQATPTTTRPAEVVARSPEKDEDDAQGYEADKARTASASDGVPVPADADQEKGLTDDEPLNRVEFVVRGRQ